MFARSAGQAELLASFLGTSDTDSDTLLVVVMIVQAGCVLCQVWFSVEVRLFNMDDEYLQKSHI
jgi:hypothetical protein